ncbi:MAG: formate dehydrogenase accessory protein FdhE [Desulfoplanes sp.]|nr:formate dehydrogenase accessory protein FdhE [Desulfoplanes sp.]
MDKERIRHDNSAKGVQKALDTLMLDKPELENMVNCFGPLLVAKAAFKETCSLPEELEDQSLHLNTNRFAQGEPLLTDIGLIDFHEDFKRAAQKLLPPMETAFIGIKGDIQKIAQGFADDSINPRECVQAFVGGTPLVLEKTAASTGTTPDIFNFIIGQLAKPFMEMQSASLAHLIAGQQWLHGYCPICGSYAAIAGLIGEGGKRWLQCATCGHEWRFDRHTCPKCNDSDHTQHDYFFDKNSPAKAKERVDECHACKSYLLTTDLRERTDPVNMEVAALGMVSLDMRAQEKGYMPLASTLWNSLT